MRINPMPVYQKGERKKRRNAPTDAQRARWKRIRRLGCLVCKLPPEIHHCETGAGGRKDHDKVAPLCYYHHRGAAGLHTLGRERFAELHGSEQEMMEAVRRMLGEP